jgi:hypothetical protein
MVEDGIIPTFYTKGSNMTDKRTYEELKTSNDRLSNILRHLLAESMPGVYFICGEAGEHDGLGLPEHILICPAYGSDVVVMYEKKK